MLNVKTDLVEGIIRDVAQTIIVPRFKNLRAHEIHFKGEDNPFTIADVEAEAALKERLIPLHPNARIVGEEECSANLGILDCFAGDDPIWTIDPIDGTKAYISGTPYYGVIVSLSCRNEALAGWLYDPSSDEFITAEKGAGAYHKGRKLRVLDPEPLEGLRGVMGARLIDAYAQCATPPDVKKPLFARMLSSCHDYARMVCGTPHFSGKQEQIHFHCWKDTCTPWDSAAGILIHGEAGGFTAHWNEERFRPSHYKRGILSAPDKASWRDLRDWILRFCELPEI